jgi:predicted RNA-binding Zn-ribbon protein involved in translation (DUF1610 family)
MSQSKYIDDHCGKCNKYMRFNKSLAYKEKDVGFVCPECIKRIYDPQRIKLGKQPIFISPSAYQEIEDE